MKKKKKSARETVKELSANTGDKEVHDIDKLDSGITAHGILEVMQDVYRAVGVGQCRCDEITLEGFTHIASRKAQ